MQTKYFILLLLAFIAAGVIGFILTPAPESTSPQTTQTSSQVGGSFELVDHHGDMVTEKEYDGYYKLIFFGFTHCPGICPGELNKMDAILQDLGSEGEKIQPLLISIDPERDTPKAMREYVELFNPRIIGLTGSPEQIEAMKESYKIYATKREMSGAMSENGEYMMDHSTYTYLMSPENELLEVFSIQETPDTISVEIKSHL